MADAETQLAGFIARYTPEIAAQGRAVIARLRAQLPTANVLVYDNYNALAVGFGPDDRASHAILSVAMYPKWVSLFFLQAAGLDDPAGVAGQLGGAERALHPAQVLAVDPVGLERRPDLADQRHAAVAQPAIHVAARPGLPGGVGHRAEVTCGLEDSQGGPVA